MKDAMPNFPNSIFACLMSGNPWLNINQAVTFCLIQTNGSCYPYTTVLFGTYSERISIVWWLSFSDECQYLVRDETHICAEKNTRNIFASVCYYLPLANTSPRRIYGSSILYFANYQVMQIIKDTTDNECKYWGPWFLEAFMYSCLGICSQEFQNDQDHSSCSHLFEVLVYGCFW